jgi:hypothetical protein
MCRPLCALSSNKHILCSEYRQNKGEITIKDIKILRKEKIIEKRLNIISENCLSWPCFGEEAEEVTKMNRAEHNITTNMQKKIGEECGKLKCWKEFCKRWPRRAEDERVKPIWRWMLSFLTKSCLQWKYRNRKRTSANWRIIISEKLKNIV